MMPCARSLYAVTEATWPPAKFLEHGPWTIRDGQRGGKRVSAATAAQPVAEDDIARAEDAMRGLDQTPLFMIREGDDMLDGLLCAAGYEVIDPVNMYACPLSVLTGTPVPRAAAYAIWEPLAIQLDIWAQGGIGPGRIAVMHRAAGPRTTILGRSGHSPAATAFVAIHDGIAMVHALEVLERHRRAGIGRLVTLQAAHWAAANGATHASVLCTRDNRAANTLYTSLGMAHVGQYHYRIKQEARHA